jgi:hypothetical protein
MTISFAALTEAIHPPLDRQSLRPGKRFESFLISWHGKIDDLAVSAMRQELSAKRHHP